MEGVENLKKRIEKVNETNKVHFNSLTEIQKTLQQLDENFGNEFQEMENCKQENFELLKNLLHVLFYLLIYLILISGR